MTRHLVNAERHFLFAAGSADGRVVVIAIGEADNEPAAQVWNFEFAGRG